MPAAAVAADAVVAADAAVEGTGTDNCTCAPASAADREGRNARKVDNGDEGRLAQESDCNQGGDEASACIGRCRERFLGGISPGDDTLAGACVSLLSTPEPHERLWQLYRCDSTRCGVWINQTGGIGQDRGSPPLMTP